MRSVMVWCAALSALILPSGLRAQSGPASAAPPTPAASRTAPPLYGARARVAEASPEPSQPTEAETSLLRHDLGPSFSLAESLPGSLPVFSGVPYLIVRGATPSGTATYFEGLSIPSLFHIALGPSVVHPRLLGKLAFYPGPSPARYGRRIGGALVAEGARVHDEQPVRELELTLLDASGYLHMPDLGTTIAWRVGDPGLLMNLFGLDATLNYFDYQVRHERRLGANTRLLLLALGSGDNLGDRTDPEDDISLTFHRWLTRITHRIGSVELGSQLVLGYDTSALGQELDGDGFRVQPSVELETRLDGARLRLGADMLATHVSLRRRFDEAHSDTERSEGLSLDPEDFLAGQPYASVPVRSVFGIYGELGFQPWSRVDLELGARTDLWLTGSEAQLAVSPTVRLSVTATPELSLHAAFGLNHQPRGSPIPLPSLTDVSIDRGLERVVQSELGLGWQLTPKLRLESTLFYHRYLDVVYLELILDCEGNTNTMAAQAALLGMDLASICRQAGLPTADGETYGAELYLKRQLTERISGFVSYTLAFGGAIARDGTEFTPQSDVRHLANAVLRFDLGSGFAMGLRTHFRSGKIAVNTIFDAPRARFERVESRLPAFFRADVRGSYTWQVPFGRMEASIGIQNLTASQEATNRDCVVDQLGDWTGPSVPIRCEVDYQPAILLPNVGIRAEM